MSTKLLFLAGSCRKESLNMKLARTAQKIVESMNVETTFIDLADYEMPLYNGDLEEEAGVPEAAKKLKKIFMAHDGFFIASPEYNSGYSPVLKNTIDWMTRVSDDNASKLGAFQGKVGALAAASPSWRGGERGLAQLRMLLGNIGVHIIPMQATFASAQNSFDEAGNISNKDHLKMLEGVIDQFVKTAKAFKGS